MLNKLPKVIAFREPTQRVLVRTSQEGELVQRTLEVHQVPFILRAIYFLLIGWWLSALWMEAAYLICLSIIGLPVGFWMFDQVPAILSLKR